MVLKPGDTGFYRGPVIRFAGGVEFGLLLPIQPTNDRFRRDTVIQTKPTVACSPS